MAWHNSPATFPSLDGPIKKSQNFQMKKIVFLIALISACGHQQQKTQPLTLTVFDCGENTVKDISLFSPGVNKGKQKTLAVRCYLIQHPKGMLMWDTGLSDKIAEQKNGIKAMNGAFTLKVNRTLASQLNEIKINPEEVKYLAFSHMHSDHTGNANLFTKAKLIVQDEEFEAGLKSDESAKKYHFAPETYDKVKRNPVMKLKADHDLFEDGSVIILRAPGHTPGHQSLLVNLPETGPVILSGDLYHFESNRTHRRVPGFNYDKAETLKSMEKIENLVAEKGAQFWIQHDPDQKIDLSPNNYR